MFVPMVSCSAIYLSPLAYDAKCILTGANAKSASGLVCLMEMSRLNSSCCCRWTMCTLTLESMGFMSYIIRQRKPPAYDTTGIRPLTVLDHQLTFSNRHFLFGYINTMYLMLEVSCTTYICNFLKVNMP